MTAIKAAIFSERRTNSQVLICHPTPPSVGLSHKFLDHCIDRADVVLNKLHCSFERPRFQLA